MCIASENIRIASATTLGRAEATVQFHASNIRHRYLPVFLILKGRLLRFKLPDIMGDPLLL